MSLLLEALKKAEKAKEDAQRQARGESAPAAAPAELRIDDLPPPEPVKHVVTRNELPKISQPLEILSDELAARPAQPEAKAAPQQPSAAPRASRPQAATADTPGAPASDRAAAKKVFEAKFKEPNPRLPFYITVGVLSVFAVGTVGYFWYQLRPPPSFINANPKPSAEQPGAVAQAAPAPAAAAAPAAGQAAIPGLPQSGGPAPAPPSTPNAAGAVKPPAIAAAAPATEASAPAKPPAPRIARVAPRPAEPAREVSVNRAGPQVNPRVTSAYSAYVSGDFSTARQDYQQALREDPGNRDALLGMAALDVRSGRVDVAEAAYLRLLQADPRDAHAHAALLSLRGARMDPIAAESRVKSLIASDPGAYELHFTLGNQLAQQARWPEAQQEYFKAFSADPENADYAYNLAVSLDHLGQAKPALEYYQRSLALAGRRGGASFDAAAARARAAQLER